MADSSRAATVRKAAMALVQQPMALVPLRLATAPKARPQVQDPLTEPQLASIVVRGLLRRVAAWYDWWPSRRGCEA
jgi:hypothetical protein